MEVPVINRISNFDGGVSTSFISQIPSLSLREKLLQPHSFWKWSAFIIAMIASFGTIISRIRILVIRLQCYFSKSPASEPLLTNTDDDLDYSDDEDEDEAVSWSSSSSVSDFEENDDNEVRADEDFSVKGSDHNLGLRRRRSSGDHSRFSWSDFSVVKLWENFGLGFELEDDDEDPVVSLYDDKKWRVSSSATSSPATMLSAGTSETGRVAVGVWDARVGCRIPAILAEWGPQLGRIVGVASDGAGNVYVRDDVSGSMTVGDLRNVSSALKSLTAYGIDESGSDSAVSRCCDAVKSYLL
ncbi:uncharacterized protein LOC112092143 [Morus notabilis]|uniref:uncharacterized protein LOC112092143 n=1 Tax=Morus notabilis TaxID=981085 RepID=UPI000CED07CA|nr:uncharacterized protein LOC112092143 [Morus notabilis]